ncbi:MAG TPA: hypothetical protein VFT50_18975 [Baekduia sp.]|nr:hypothetical protein [Baekduia sp.]
MVLIVLLVVVLVLIGTAYGLYSRHGSQITPHPRNEERDAPGAARPSGPPT